MKNLSVGIIEPVGNHGGMHYYNVGLSNGLDSADVNTFLYTNSIGTLAISPGVEVKCYFAGMWEKKNKVLKLYKYILGLLKSLFHIKCNKIGVVHLHFFNLNLLDFLTLLICKLSHLKVVVTLHDVESFHKEKDRYFKMICNISNRFIAHNDFSFREIVRKNSAIREKIHIIPHGSYSQFIDENALAKDNCRRMLGLGQKDKVILFFGQIKKVKGLEILLKALPNVCARLPETLLLIAGKLWKSDFQPYEDLIELHGIKNHVKTNIEFIPDENVEMYFRSSDVIVLPYRKIYQSGVLLMAMSYGVSVVVSDIDGMVELVDDLNTGYVFRDGDEKSLASKLILALEDTATNNKIAMAGHKKMIEEHNWDEIGEATSTIYRNLIR